MEREPVEDQWYRNELNNLINEVDQGLTDNYWDHAAFLYLGLPKQDPETFQKFKEKVPSARYIGTKAEWREYGWDVAKGEKGKVINHKRYYTIDQLTERPQELWDKLPDDAQDKYLWGKAAADSYGYSVREEKTFWNNIGAFDNRTQTIIIREDMDSRNKVFTLFHEWAHGIIENGVEQEEKDTAEYLAESAAYITAKYLGLKSPWSSDYIKIYDGTTEDLRINADKIIALSKLMIEELKLFE